MHKRKLGPDGPLVSAVGIGAMSFAGFYGPTTEAEAHALLASAPDMGIDHLDTSNVYGMGLSESIIGSYLAATGRRADPPFRIATKAGITRDKETGERCFDNSKAHLEAELNGSLERLGVDVVDLFYVHRRDQRIPIEEVTETLAGFIKAGKIRSFGYSEIAPSSLRRAFAVHPVAAVQSEYSLSTRFPELGLVQACEELGTALVAFSPVGRALLTDTPPTKKRVTETGFMQGNPRFQSPNFEKNLEISDGFRALAADMSVPTAALAIAWLVNRSEAVIPIPGTRSVDHLHELARGGGMTLSADDMARIEAVLPVGWAHGDRYSDAQWIGPEKYC
ncbi:MAG: aldo/keto reductase [Rhodobiaceae bacterium]|nr:aldo/keto reductase [Rhodobiaceae bacterium]